MLQDQDVKPAYESPLFSTSMEVLKDPIPFTAVTSLEQYGHKVALVARSLPFPRCCPFDSCIVTIATPLDHHTFADFMHDVMTCPCRKTTKHFHCDCGEYCSAVKREGTAANWDRNQWRHPSTTMQSQKSFTTVHCCSKTRHREED